MRVQGPKPKSSALKVTVVVAVNFTSPPTEMSPPNTSRSGGVTSRKWPSFQFS